MTPEIYHFPNQYKNDTFDGVEFTFQFDDTFVGVDLTGTNIKIQFRGGYQDSVLIKELTNKPNGGIQNIDLPKGVFYLNPFVIDWEEGIYKYDIQMTLGDGSIKTFIKGTVTVEANITKDN